MKTLMSLGDGSLEIISKKCGKWELQQPDGIHIAKGKPDLMPRMKLILDPPDGFLRFNSCPIVSGRRWPEVIRKAVSTNGLSLLE